MNGLSLTCMYETDDIMIKNIINNLILLGFMFFSYVFYPLIIIFSTVARFATKIVGGGEAPQNMFITREEIRVLLDISDSASDPSTIDRKRIRRIIRFADTTVGEAMIPLADVVGFNEDRNMKEAIRVVIKHGFNRLPVYRGNITNVQGMLTLSSWDLMDLELEDKAITDYICPTLYLSPKQTIDQALPQLQARDDHMAVVVDEYGSAIGILTMEDVFEEVVGEIDVGYDFEEYLPRRKRIVETLEEDVYLMDSRLPISETNEILGTNLSAAEFHTIGGLVMARLRHIPKEGEFIVESGYKVTVEQATERSISKLRVERVG